MGETRAREGAPAPGVASRGDGHLAELACSGDAEAFDSLIARHHGSVYRLCWSLLCDGSDAEDAAQETFLRAYQSLARFDTERAFGPWVRGIATKVCLQLLRRRARRSDRVVSLDASYVEPAAPDQPEPSPLAAKAVAALGRLDDTYRLPLTLFYLEEASVAEVAETLGITPGTARVRLHRGREKLRQMLMPSSGTNDEDA